MKYSAQNLAKALVVAIKVNPDNYGKIVSGFIDFCKERKIAYLMPNVLSYFKIEFRREEEAKTLRIHGPASVSEKTIKDIQNTLGANRAIKIDIIEDKKITAGFIASYDNKILDATLESNLNVLKSKLINN